MNPDDFFTPGRAMETAAEIMRQRDKFALAVANVAVYTAGRTDLTGEEIAALLRGEVPDRLRWDCAS